MENIKHIVYLMLENRSLDQLLGWLYDDAREKPAHFIPSTKTAPYQGLFTGKYYNPDCSGNKHYAGMITSRTDDQVPSVDPHEAFEFVTQQIYGPDCVSPGGPEMLGFYESFKTVAGSTPDQIMQCYAPSGLQTINALAKSFAVSDMYFSSIPTQTNCNRAFSLTGNSIGQYGEQLTAMVDNHWHWDGDPYEFNQRSIFSVLNENGMAGNMDWMVFYNQTWPLPDDYRYCYTRDLIWPTVKNSGDNFADINTFFQQLHDNQLPSFSFLEPAWYLKEDGVGWNGSDYHPPANLTPGESFLGRLYMSLLVSPAWKNTLLIINFDEHGGTFDHCSPPPAKAPWDNPADGTPNPPGKEQGFDFKRYGVRVPLILVSPYIQHETLLRPDGDTPFDHASVIATVLDHLNIPRDKWKLGTRVANAPTFHRAVSLTEPRTDDLPELDLTEPERRPADNDPPNELQWLIVRRMLIRVAHENNYPKEKRLPLMEEHLGSVKSMKELDAATEKLYGIFTKGGA